MVPPGWLTDRLPASSYRSLRVETDDGGLVLRFHDLEGVEWAVQTHPESPDRHSLYSSAGLCWSYQAVDPSIPAIRASGVCRTVAASLDGLEDRLRGLLQSSERAVSQHAWVSEDTIRGGANLDDLLGEGPFEQVQLHLDTPCQQSCVFCTWAHGQRHTPGTRKMQERRARWHRDGGLETIFGVAEQILARLRAQPRPGGLELSGNDCLRHPLIGDLLDLLSRERVVPITMLGPMTALADPALADRVAALPTLTEIRLGMNAIDAPTHDALAGAPGALADVLTAIESCVARDVFVRVVVVVTGPNADRLDPLLGWLESRSLMASLHVFRPERLDGGEWAPELSVSAPRLRAGLSRIDAGRASLSGLQGFAICALPEDLRHLAVPMGDDPNRIPFVYPPPCEGCAHRARCPGVSPLVHEAFGDAAVAPER